MSVRQSSHDHELPCDHPEGSVLKVIRPRPRDLGDGFVVKRALPERSQRSIGPFVFLDEMGPVDIVDGQGAMEVRPHPHIGLSTFTYLFEGGGLHRDSLGNVVEVVVGDVNLMTAGRGIVHSERTPDALLSGTHTMHGLQAWLALPKPLEDDPPSFTHVPKADLPHHAGDGWEATVLAGTAWGSTSPVPQHHPVLYVDLRLQAGAQLAIPDAVERGVYVVTGAVLVDGIVLGPGDLAVLATYDNVTLVAEADSVVMILGGAPLDGPRHMWWNFVHSDAATLERAKAAWTASAEAGFDGTVFTLPPDEHEHIPLPS